MQSGGNPDFRWWKVLLSDGCQERGQNHAVCCAPASVLLSSSSRTCGCAIRSTARSRSRPVLAADTVRICIHECVGADSSITLSGFMWGYPSE